MRILAIILALFYGANGLVMLFLPAFWDETVPGVTETGPFNPHFVRDIGLGFVAAAAALALSAHHRHRRLIWPAVIFLSGHAMLHLVEIVTAGEVNAAVRDLVMIVLPGFLPMVLFAARPHRRTEPDWTKRSGGRENARV